MNRFDRGPVDTSSWLRLEGTSRATKILEQELSQRNLKWDRPDYKGGATESLFLLTLVHSVQNTSVDRAGHMTSHVSVKHSVL